MNNHKCSICGRGFGTSSNLRRHEKSHVKKEVKAEIKKEQPTTPTRQMGMVTKREQNQPGTPQTQNGNMMGMMSVKQEETRLVERPWEYR